MDPYALERRLTCILAADAVGYSKHMGHDEEGTIQVLAAHRAVIDGIIAFHRGRIVGTAGDSVLAEFTSAVEAVRCAVEIQDALRTRNDALPEERRLQFRVGVNLGDVVVKDADLLGDGVNVAARLESLAEPGGVCIASSVYDQITGKLDLGFLDIGEQNLKNITRPVRVYRVSGVRPAEPSGMVQPERGILARPGRPFAWLAAGVALALMGFGVLWFQGWIHPPGTVPSAATAAAASGVARPEVAMPAPATTTSAPLLAPAAPVAQVLAPAAVSLAATQAAASVVAHSEVPAAPVSGNAPLHGHARQRMLQRRAEGDTPRAFAQAERASERTDEPRAVAPADRRVAAGAFDGNWTVRLQCPRHEEGAQGYRRELLARVHNGHLRAELGSVGEPGWLLLQGRIQADGSARLHAEGLTGNPRFAVKGVPSGSPYQFDVDATFNGNEGRGQRQQLRACTFAFQRV